MARKKLEVNPKQSQRLKQILQEQNKSQKWLAGQISISEKMISTMVNGTSAVTPETADLITSIFPEYRKSWLLGFDDYMNDKEYLEGTIKECQTEVNLLYSGVLAFLKISGYDISPAYENDGTLEGTVKALTSGYVISRDGQSVPLDLLQFNLFANKISDYVDFELQHMIKNLKSD